MFGARAGGIERRRRPPDPAVLVAAVGRRGVPERDRREVRERRLVVADALDDGHLAVVVELLHPAHRLVPAEVRVDLEEVLLLDADRRPMLVVGRRRRRARWCSARRCRRTTRRRRGSGPTGRPPPPGWPGSGRSGTGPMPPNRPNPRPPAPSRIMSRRETPESLSRVLVVTGTAFRGQGYRCPGRGSSSFRSRRGGFRTKRSVRQGRASGVGSFVPPTCCHLRPFARWARSPPASGWPTGPGTGFADPSSPRRSQPWWGGHVFKRFLAWAAAGVALTVFVAAGAYLRDMSRAYDRIRGKSTLIASPYGDIE